MFFVRFKPLCDFSFHRKGFFVFKMKLRGVKNMRKALAEQSTQQRREHNNKYQREYRKRNPDKVAKWNLNYYRRKLEQYTEQSKTK
jgi:hypothetical protein